MINEYMKALRENLYRHMHKNDWNLTELAIQCGMSYGNLRRILSGESKSVGLDTLEKISEGLDIPIDVLIGVEGNNKKDADFINGLFYTMQSYIRGRWCR